MRNCTKDEGRPLETGLQEQASNHLKLHWLRVIVVSVKEKASLKGSGRNQGDERKRTIDEVSKSEDVVKTGDSSRSSGGARRIPAYCPGGVRHKDGMTLFQAFARNVGCAGRSL